MSEQIEKNTSSEIEKNEADREKINDILDRFQQKWGKTNSQIAKELGISDVSLSYAKNGKRSGKNILARLRKLADDYGLDTPESEEDQAQKEYQLQLARQLSSSKVHPALLQSAYAYLGFEPGAPFLSMLGDEGIVKLALQKQAQKRQFLEFLFAPKQKLPQLPAPAPAPAPALPSPHNVTIIEESTSPVPTHQVIRWCRSCGINIKGTIYEVPAENPTYGYLYDYYCEQCEQKRRHQYQAQKQIKISRWKR